MQKVQLFNVGPTMPKKIAFLETLARNLWWCWHAESIELFRRIDPRAWNRDGHNPLVFLNRLRQGQLESLAEDDSFLGHLEEVQRRFKAEVARPDSCTDPAASCCCIAYMSLEYGLHESVKMYSGGLGVLAGDHVKAASDMRLPLVGVGLLYRQGYFQQHLDPDGLQQESYPEHKLNEMPVVRARDAGGNDINVTVPLPEGPLHAAVFRLEVGRVPLLILDTNIPENSPELRATTAKLYTSDRRTRLRQELLLGIGGFKALQAVGCDPHVFHMNEGHAAFVNLARISHLVREKGMDMEVAREVVVRTSVFTTHTPVPAGNEAFAVDLVTPHLAALQEETGILPATVVGWGRAGDGSQGHELSMTVLGLRLAELSNGVSKLHGRVARQMWAHLWPGRPEDEVPISSITNGIHVPTWLAPDLAALFDRYLGPHWRSSPEDPEILERVAHMPNEDLWRAHELCRGRLIRTVREHGEQQMRARNAPAEQVAHIRSILNFDVLTVGFARRFAVYKRGTLLLRDPERLEALLTHLDRPVQFVFAGKAHPSDQHGKELIRQIVHFARKANIRHRMVFLENYNVRVARSLVQGVDVWLNTPRRPHEASGTSGMKAAVNGALNLSVLDGWWDEAYTPERGWAIGAGEEHADSEYQDSVESQALYNLLENEVVPAFYDRGAGDLPLAWINRMKASIAMALEHFTSHRMVAEYRDRFYDPALKAYDSLVADDAARARALLEQRRRLTSLWEDVRIEHVHAERDVAELHVGDRFVVSATVSLGRLSPDEVDVQVYFGPVNSENSIVESRAQTMKQAGSPSGDARIYTQEVTCESTGRYGFTVRAVPRGAEWTRTMPGFMAWADGA